MTQKNVSLSIYGFLSVSHIKGCKNHTISKDAEKLRSCRYNLCIYSRLHKDRQVLTWHVGKTVELWCFRCNSVARGTDVWLFDVCYCYLCNIIRAYREVRTSDNCFAKKWLKKNGHRKTFSQWNRFFGLHTTSRVFFHDCFCKPPASFLGKILFEWPLASTFRALSKI